MRRPDDRQHQTVYEIRLAGHLDARRAAQFDGLALRLETDGMTVLSGPIADQAALHGLLQLVRDLGIPLVSVVQLDASRNRRVSPLDTDHH
jgi:hypothetical protein